MSRFTDFQIRVPENFFKSLTPSNASMLKSPRKISIFLPTRYCKQSMNSDNGDFGDLYINAINVFQSNIIFHYLVNVSLLKCP